MKLTQQKDTFEMNSTITDRGYAKMVEEVAITPSLENYLETIFFLDKQNGVVRVTDVAIEMSISKPSVNKAIKNLKQQGYVLHERYGSVTLTEKGLEVAKIVVSKHVVLKKLLHELIGVSEEVAEIEACKIEHVISADTLTKISNYIDVNVKF